MKEIKTYKFQVGEDVVNEEKYINGMGQVFILHHLKDGWIRIWEHDGSTYVEGVEAKDMEHAYKYMSFRVPMWQMPPFTMI